ncbi:MAG: DUF6468 domain-containing protein [Alphaproteobacteria bacterium]
MSFEIFLNILIIALLSVGITYAVILEHRLSGAKENRHELARLIEQFYKASQKTAEEFIRLKQMEDTARQALKTDMERAALLRDELNFLITKAQNSRPLPAAAPTKQQENESETKVLSKAEQDLIDALNALK